MNDQDRSASASARASWRPSGRCPIFVCDIASFGDPERHDRIQRHLRQGLYACLENGFDAVRLPLARCYKEDRGDGAIVVVPPETDLVLLISDLPDRLRRELRRRNELANELARIRLRTSVHVGEVCYDGSGIVGTAVNHVNRLIDAPMFKEALGRSTADLALIFSLEVYEAVVRFGDGLIDPLDYQPVDVAVKETRTVAWMRVFGTTLPDNGLGSGSGQGPASSVLDARPPEPSPKPFSGSPQRASQPASAGAGPVASAGAGPVASVGSSPVASHQAWAPAAPPGAEITERPDAGMARTADGTGRAGGGDRPAAPVPAGGGSLSPGGDIADPRTGPRRGAVAGVSGVQGTAGFEGRECDGAALTPDRIPVRALFEIVERLVAVPIMAGSEGRGQIVGMLRAEIATRVPRSPQANLDAHAILMTCLSYPGGLQELLAVVRAFAGDSHQVVELERAVARFLVL